MSLSDRLRKLDTHTTVESEFIVRTAQGGLLSAVTLVVCAYLTYTEYKYNLTASKIDRVHANATVDTGLELEFDVTFPKIACAFLAIDANDPQGQAQSLHIDRKHRVWKHRLTPDGEKIGRKNLVELGNTLQTEDHMQEVGSKIIAENTKRIVDDMFNDEPDCGSCYGAGDEGECCNTCDDVKRTYMRKGWQLPEIEIKQCANEMRISDEDGEGCNVHGKVALSSGGGNLHIAPGHSLENFGHHNTLNILDLIQNTFEQFNVSHTINKLRFGEQYPGGTYQLDGALRMIDDLHGMYQYYTQVVPTKYTYLDGSQLQTFQFSVTEHMRHLTPGGGRGVPGLYIFYEVAPLHVDIEEYRHGWIRFFTSVCAIVGGVFTVMGAMDKIIFTAQKGEKMGGLKM